MRVYRHPPGRCHCGNDAIIARSRLQTAPAITLVQENVTPLNNIVLQIVSGRCGAEVWWTSAAKFHKSAEQLTEPSLAGTQKRLRLARIN